MSAGYLQRERGSEPESNTVPYARSVAKGIHQPEIFNHSFPVIDLDRLLHEPAPYIAGVLEKIKPIKLFEEYLHTGYYPFFMEDDQTSYERLKQTVNHVLETDLPSVGKIDFNAVHHLRTLLSIISEIVPFKPNVLKLSNRVGVSRETLVKYLYLLARADLLMLLQSGTQGIGQSGTEPEKIYTSAGQTLCMLFHIPR